MEDNQYLLIIYSVLGVFVLVGLFMLIHFRNQGMIWRQRRQMQENEIARQKELLDAVTSMQEDERRRIGQDLHDQVGSALSALRLLLHPRLGGGGQAGPETRDLIDGLIRDVRSISHDLSPEVIRMAGLYPALEEFAALVNRGGGLELSLEDHSRGALGRLPEKTALALYRVLTQLVDNTLRHAGATGAEARFGLHEGTLHIRYADNGRGCSEDTFRNSTGMGLQNIRNRLEMIGAEYRFRTENGFDLEIWLKTEGGELKAEG